jgi:CheY-like chemotaxis protein
MNRKVTMAMLETMGYSVTMFANGVESVKEIREIEKERQNNSSVPVIVITPNTMRGDKERYLKAGMNYYIVKPVKREVLVEAIKKFTDAFSPGRPIKFNPSDGLVFYPLTC